MALVYDDRDAAVEYSAGNWGDAGGREEFRGTTSYSDRTGATARVTFTGRGITVYGTITNQGLKGSPVSSYVIDGDSSSRFQFTGLQLERIQYLVPFYSVSDLEYGEHVLTITNEAENYLYLDYFEITGFNDPGSSPVPDPPSSSPNSPPSSSSNLPPSSSPNPPSGSQSVGSSGSQSPSPSTPAAASSPSSSIRTSGPTKSLPTSSPSGSASSLPADSASQGGGDDGPPIGAIVGGVLGALAVICIAILLFIFFRRKRQRRGALVVNDHISQMQTGPSQSQPLVTPFDTYDYHNSHPAHGAFSMISGHSQGGGGGIHNPTVPLYPTVHSKSMAAGHEEGSGNYMREVAASPIPPSSRSVASGITGGGSSGYPTGTIDSHQRDMTSISSGFSGSQKLMSNVVLVAPNRAPELIDPPPGYQA